MNASNCQLNVKEGKGECVECEIKLLLVPKLEQQVNPSVVTCDLVSIVVNGVGFDKNFDGLVGVELLGKRALDC